MTSESPRVVESGALDSKGGSKLQEGSSKLQEGSKERSPPLVPDGPSINGGVSDVQSESKTDSDSGIGGEGRKSDVESSGGGTPKVNPAAEIEPFESPPTVQKGESDPVDKLLEDGFPIKLLESLEEQLGRPKWVVPVRPKDELEMLLRVCIRLAKDGKDVDSEPCLRFYKDGLNVSFIRILTDDAVNTWKPDIQLDIFNNARLLVELCVLKLPQDNVILLEILSICFNPTTKWNLFNAAEPSATYVPGADLGHLFARPLDTHKHNMKGRLVDLINLFGDKGGFRLLHNRIVNGENLSVPVLAALLKPFGACSELLTDYVYDNYIVPVVDKTIAFVDGMTDELLKKEAATDAKSETFSSIMKSLRHLCRRIPGREDVETFRLKMILRLLQIASFSGKMNALNEINKVLPTLTYHPHFRTVDDDQLQADKIAEWVKANNVLTIVFRENLHQPQYVEKLDRLVRFCIKERVVTLEDLDRIWACQDGKHEAIVKNIHDLLVKLAWDFSAEQLDHLFGCFQRSWVGSSKKQRDDLLEFIRHLAEDDKEGIMAGKVLDLLWNLAHRDDCPNDTMEHALNAHIKILDYSCSQERESQKLRWLQRCVDEVTQGIWVIPALKQMKEICMLYLEPPMNYNVHHRSTHFYYRNDIISHLDQNYHLLSHICSNLSHYMQKAKAYVADRPELDSETLCVDGKFNHRYQIQIRLDFVRFALKDGQLWLGHNQALLVWESLAGNPAFPSDRDACFKWFAKLAMWDEPDIEPETARRLFTDNILRLPPSALTDNGFRCFDRFFRMVNLNQQRLSKWNRTCFITESVELIGLDYLWDVILMAPEAIIHKPIELMKDVFTNLSTKLPQEQIHHDFIGVCMQRLELIYKSLFQYKPGEIDNEPPEYRNSYRNEVNKLVRCLKLLLEYVVECDDDHMEERSIPPHGKAHWGKPFVLTVRYLPGHTHQSEDFDLWTHTNETVASLRRQIARRLNLTSHLSKLELAVGNEPFRKGDNHRYVGSASIPLRDKMVVMARLQQYSNISETSMQSDNSTDSSDGSVVGGHVEGVNVEVEKMLPSVLMASCPRYVDFLMQLCDFAVQRSLTTLRDHVRMLLKTLPTGLKLLAETIDHCRECATLDSSQAYAKLNSYIFSGGPSRAVYILEVVQSMLMPAVDIRDTDSNEFQSNFIQSGGLKLIVSILTDAHFLSEGDNNLKRAALMSCLKVLKLLLVAQALTFIISVSHEIKHNTAAINSDRHRQACQVQDAINTILPSVEQKLRSFATNIAKNLPPKLISPAPSDKLVQSLLLLCWSSAVGDITLASDADNIHLQFDKLANQPYCLEPDDIQLTKEALEVMCLSLAVSSGILTNLHSSALWKSFIIDIILLTRNRLIRVCAQEQLFNSITRCCTSTEVLLSSINLMFEALETKVSKHPSTSNEFFKLLSKLINHAHIMTIPVAGVRELLDKEIKWLTDVRDKSLELSMVAVEGSLLDGHLTLIVELLSFSKIEERYTLGSKPGGLLLIEKLVNDFLFPASRIVKELKQSSDIEYDEQLAGGICSNVDSTISAFRLINALCMGCQQNLEVLSRLLINLFYSDSDPPLTEWEFFHHVGARSNKSYVGLKNAGATCYMNAVLQQLYVIPPVRRSVLSLEEPAECLVKEEEDLEKKEKEQGKKKRKNSDKEEEVTQSSSTSSELRADTNRRVLMQIQSIFGHLLEGKTQFHIPKGFWRDFRLDGQKVNLREQHDAFEFFNTLVDSIDEGLKSFGTKQVLSGVLGGSFADQKICKGCPHRYSREEPFTAINVDIRLHHNLFESLDSYVKGDLLEGANAYKCEKCNKKVDTVKRMCIKNLPQVLVIQLKRFDYDWEREMAVKFNDYFEFPREFDISPYTAAGLAKLEGEEIPDTEADDKNKENTTSSFEGVATPIYRLRGIVVHSGQASGGHYYSFIHVKCPATQVLKWYKFDDGEVTEAKMDDEEELRSQCFGGEYTGEVYDHVLKKSHQRRQKRWWSAYLLFYDRVGEDGQALIQADPAAKGKCHVPLPILKQVHRQNLDFLHTRAHFSYAYFQFMRQLLMINYSFTKSQLDFNASSEAVESFEKLGMLCMQLVTRFLFHSGFHSKKNLRGSSNDWFEALYPYLHYSARIRRWFCQEVFVSHPERLCEYLLECPSTELRNMFAKLVPFLCHVCNRDEKYEVKTQTNSGILVSQLLFSEIVFDVLLRLLNKEVSDHSRHLQQYFQVFLAYAHKGPLERQQLLKMGVPAHFIAVALDEGPGPPLRSPYADLTKLYSVVGILVRCCDVSAVQRTCKENGDPLPNPYADPELNYKLPNDLQHWLYERSSIQHSTTYVKKLIEDSSPIDETLRFLGFCCWENCDFSATVISDLLVEVGTVQAFEMRPYLDLLHHLLLMEDTWQYHRLRACFHGVPERVDGMLLLIRHGQTHMVHQKRAYLCIKFIVNLCNRCPAAHHIVEDDPSIKQQWNYALQWLQTELERRHYTTSTYPYAGWSPPAQSNEVSNGYFLERSNSARLTLTRARELFPVEEVEEAEAQQTYEEEAQLDSHEHGVSDFNRQVSEDTPVGGTEEFPQTHDPSSGLDNIDEGPSSQLDNVVDNTITHDLD